MHYTTKEKSNPQGNVANVSSVKMSRIVSFVLLSVVIVGMAFIAYMKSQGVDINDLSLKEVLSRIVKENGRAEKEAILNEISFNPKENPVFHEYKGLIIKCTKDYIKALNKKGEEVWSRHIAISKPLIKSNGSELVVADLEGKDIYVFSGRNLKWNEKFDGKLINVDISESGYIAVVQEGKGFRNTVRVFDPRGLEMFIRNIGEKYVISANIAPSGEQLIINSLDVSGVDLNPTLEFFDMMGNPYAARTLESGMIFPLIKHLEDDSFLAASDSLLVFYDRDRNEKWRRNFQKVYSADILLEKYVVAAVKNKNAEGRGSYVPVVEIINNKGQTTAISEICDEVVNIRTFSDIIAVNTGREVFFINSKGRLVGKYSSKSDIEDVYLFNKMEAAVVTKTCIAVVSVMQ